MLSLRISTSETPKFKGARRAKAVMAWQLIRTMRGEGGLRRKRSRSAAGHIVVQRVRLLGLQSVCDRSHDLDDLKNDIGAGAAGSTSQQILHSCADLCFGVVLIYKIPIELVWHGSPLRRVTCLQTSAAPSKASRR